MKTETEPKFSGILLPHLAWKWVVTFNNPEYNILTQQAKSVDIDYLAKTATIMFYEPQWVLEFEKALLSFIEQPLANVVIEFRSGNTDHSTTKATHLLGKTTECKMSLDYAANETNSITMVKLVFKYDNIQILESTPTE
jgi:hypothetical protein